MIILYGTSCTTYLSFLNIDEPFLQLLAIFAWIATKCIIYGGNMRACPFGWMTVGTNATQTVESWNTQLLEMLDSCAGPSLTSFSSFIHAECLGWFSMSYLTNLGKGCEMEKVIVLCPGALLGLHCKWIIHAKNWSGALDKEQRAIDERQRMRRWEMLIWINQLWCNYLCNNDVKFLH